MKKDSSAACRIYKKNTERLPEPDRPKFDILVKVYKNRIFIALANRCKFGTFISITRQSSPENSDLYLYDLRVLFGDERHLPLARYIAEKIKPDRPLLLTIGIRPENLDVAVGKADRADIVAAIKKLKTW